MGAGASWLAAQAGLGLAATSLVAAGTGQSDATAIPSDFNVFTSTTGSNYGARLPVSTGNVAQITDIYVVVNHCGQTMKVYPPLGGSIANGSPNAAFSVSNTKTATLYCLGAGNWAASVSA
jgi:hypothetical protein